MPAELKVRALPNNVLVRPVKRERTTPGGLIVPYQVDERPQEGEIISVGSDICMDCSVGDIVLYLKLGVDKAGDAQRDSPLDPQALDYGRLEGSERLHVDSAVQSNPG